jgi:RHS repeat-associated protein
MHDNSSFTWAEQDLYGSSRLGMVTPGLTIQSSAPLANANYNPTGDPITNGTEGKRIYELTNHLGNVMVTISDRKTGVDENGDAVIDYYKAEVLTAQDYYAFGMMMPGRTYSNAGAKYKYGFNGQENDNEVKGEGNSLDFGDRIYDSRLGRWLSLDPLQRKYPWESHYSFVSNNPILYIDADGKDKIITHKYIDVKTGETYIVRQVVSNDIKAVPKRVANGNHWWQDSHDWHWEYDWHDINQEVVHVMSNGSPVKTTVGPETLGEVRLTTDYNMEWYAKTQIARYEGGVIFTSQKGRSEEVKTAILPVDIINIDALLETFDVASKAGTTKNFHDKLDALAKAKGLKEKSAALKDLKTIIDNTIDIVKKVAEKVPSGTYSPDDNKKIKYTANSTICISCGNNPHGLTDGITDEEGKVVDTIKHTIRIKYNPKTKGNETIVINDTIPTKKE